MDIVQLIRELRRGKLILIRIVNRAIRFVLFRSISILTFENNRNSICSSLVCTVTCINQSGEKCNLKKVFKLPVGSNEI